jgi:cell division protein FtsI/penicillin-binding protein 2
MSDTSNTGPSSRWPTLTWLFARTAKTARPSKPAETPWRATIKARVTLLLVGLAVWAAVIEGRLVQLQVFQHNELVRTATHQQYDRLDTPAQRGDILDRRGRLLAYSVDGTAARVYPSRTQDPVKFTAALCAALGDCDAAERANLTRRLGGRNSFYLRRARSLTPDQAHRLAALKLPQVELLDEPVRYYPNLDLAAHVLGFVNPDNGGLGGVERALDEVIRGTPGTAIVQVDAKGDWMQTRVETPAVPGATVELTIDRELQHIAERELRAGVEANRAAGGTVIIMAPQTGEILALANYPTFNPNAYTRFSDDARRNRATQDVYEPGSTFKIVTASAALQEGVLHPDDLIDCSPGYITFPGRKPIRDTHPNGVITFEDVIVKSSNVGAIKAGLRVGAERMSRYVRRFGFGEALGPDFIGKSAGIVYGPSDLDDSALASMSMGYQISVTPLQMATAASAVANGGLLLEPHVVGAIVRGGRREPIAPKVLREAITRETATTLTSIMEDVVIRGTAKSATLDRYQVAGKTGTAKQVVNGRYADGNYNSSFVGFVPSRRPAITVLVVIDRPRAAGYYGGTVSGPIFKRVAEAAMQYLGVPPTTDVAPVAVTHASVPLPSRDMRAALVAAAVQPGQAVMPDVRGLSARDALRVLSRAGLTVNAAGDGWVVDQSPAAGQIVDTGATSTLRLGRPTRSEGGGAPR